MAAIKTAELARLLCALGEVRIVATDASRHFLSGLQLPPEVQHIYGGYLFVLLHKACIWTCGHSQSAPVHSEKLDRLDKGYTPV